MACQRFPEGAGGCSTNQHWAIQDPQPLASISRPLEKIFPIDSYRAVDLPVGRRNWVTVRKKQNVGDFGRWGWWEEALEPSRNSLGLGQASRVMSTRPYSPGHGGPDLTLPLFIWQVYPLPGPWRTWVLYLV